MSSKYQMWLTYNAEKEKIQLPVLPEEFSVTNGSNNDSPAIQLFQLFPGSKIPGIAGRQNNKAPNTDTENQHMESKQEAYSLRCDSLWSGFICHY